MHDRANRADPAAAPALDDLSLSGLQTGMLYQALLAPSAGFDVEQVVVRLNEELDLDLLCAAWRLVAARHDALRLCFRLESAQGPLQRFEGAIDAELTRHDWRGDTGDAEQRLSALLEADRRHAFDLRRPPWRVHLCQCTGGRTVMVWSIHHLVIDGRAFVRVLDEVMRAHAALRDGAAPSLSPVTRSMESVLRARHSNGLPAADADYWRDLLAGSRVPTPLPFAEPTSSLLPQQGSGSVTRLLDPGTTAGLHALAVACGTGMGAVVNALWALLLMRFSGEDDVVFGTTRSTRRARAREDAADVVGMFINTYPLRATLTEDGTLRDLVAQLRRQTHLLRDHQRTNLAEIARHAALPGGAPLLETIVMFDTASLQEVLQRADPSWRRREVTVLEQPTAPLVLTAFDGPSLTLRLIYRRDRVRQRVAERLVRHLDALARRMAQGADQRLDSLDTMPDEERRTILQTWNDTACPFPDAQRIHEGFEARADQQPHAIAIVQGDQQLSYQALEEQANRLAHLLRQRGAAPGRWVGLCVGRSPRLIVALLGIAKSGAAYVPLDPDYPADRIDFMLRDSGAELVVTERGARDRLGEQSCIVLDGDDRAALAAMPTARPPPVGSAQDVCYAIYTSGSTGRPKGVVLTHQAVVNTFDWVSRTFEVRPSDRLLFVTSPCFDLSVYDTFGALAAGATVEVASADELKDPAALAHKLLHGDITIWDSAPQALQRLVPLWPERASKSHLRLVMLSGDWIPLSLPPTVQRVFPNVEVKSLGGATEAAIWSNWFAVERFDPRWASVPYGRPIQNARYHVLDRRMRPTPPGVPGDLYIGGACLAEGYLNRKELTAERFVPDPFREREPDGRPARLYKTGDLARYFDDDGPMNGQLEFLGRADFQVKVRGFRVELGEIEAVLLQHDSVDEAVCVARRDASGEQSVWAYVTLRTGAELDAASAPAQLRRAIGARVPEYMVPAGVVVLDKMPMSSNGKLDRAALPDPTQLTTTSAATPPRTPLERRLAEIWAAVLGRPSVGVDDNFFDLGGHSLLAVLLVNRIKRDLALDVPLSAVLEHPTVAALSATVERKGEQKKGHLVTFSASGAPPALLLVPGIGGHVFNFRPLAQRLAGARTIYGLSAIGMEPGDAPSDSIEAIAERYDRELAEASITGPLVLGGFSVGGLTAFELAARLVARGVRVEGLVLFDALAPGYPAPLPRHQRALIHLEEFFKRRGSERRDYVLERLRNVGRRAAFRVGLGHLVAPRLEGADEVLDIRLRKLWARMSFARDAYLPRHRFDGPLLLFKTEDGFDWVATRLDDPAYGWRRFVTGEVHFAQVKGAHERIFIPENLENMAATIEQFIAQCQRHQASA